MDLSGHRHRPIFQNRRRMGDRRFDAYDIDHRCLTESKHQTELDARGHLSFRQRLSVRIEHIQKALKKLGMRQSMSAKGDCWDNAVAESFFHSLKTEWTQHQTYSTKKEAMEDIADYMMFYNRTRLHSYNDYCSPLEMEMRWWQNQRKLAA